MRPVGIIGGGITGLTAAFYLKRNGIPVVVHEASGHPGGVIRSVRKDGFLAEHGPNTILETSPKVTQLVRDAGLSSRRLDPDAMASARYVVRYRRPISMPASPLGFFTTNLFSWNAKLAVLREPFVPRRSDGKEESVAEFVTRRLNREFLDQAIDALVAGIYAGDPARLSVQQALPKLARLEGEYGSLIKGQIFGARDRKRRGEIAKDRAPKFSFDEGLQVLPATLAAFIGDGLRLNSKVSRLSQTGSGWDVEFEEGCVESHGQYSAVIYSGTAYQLAKLRVESNKAQDTNVFSEIRHPPIASVVLGFRRQDVLHPCSGFGMLIPKVEGFRILGTIFSSSLFPNRAPTGYLTLSSYIGGERQPELASLPPNQLVSLTCEDLAILLGVKGKPVFQHTAFYPRSIPQYNLGYSRYKDRFAEMESNCRGLFLAGHYRDGVSLSDSIISGCNVADRVAAFCVADSAAVPTREPVHT